MKVLDFHIAKYIIETHHYAHRLKPPSLSLGFYIKDELSTVVCFGQPAGKSVVKHIFGEGLDSNVWELSRLFSFDWAPKNIESMCIGMSLRYIKDNYLNIKAIVSFADENHQHVGTIYQASNFIYLGSSKGAGSLWTDRVGRTYHKRYTGDYKKLHKLAGKTDREIGELLGFTSIREVKCKHRYVYLLGDKRQVRELKKRILLKEQLYPKLGGRDE